jgi:hypothetical protein
MEIRTSTVAVIAASCITVGAAGAFLASRPSRAPQPAPVADVATAGVEQSEALVSDAAVAPAAETAETVPAQPVPAQPKAAAPKPASTPRAAAPPTAPVTQPRPAAPVASTPRAVDPAPVYAPAPVAAPVARTEPRTEPAEPTAPAEPPEPKGPKFVDLVVSTDSVLGLQIDSALTSEKARVEDEVLARVTRDVRVGDRVAIPAGSQARGEVTMVERGGKMRERARLGVRFTSVVLADGTRVPLETDTIYREGDSPAAESTAKIGGGAIGGAILGGIFGGAKGAAIGAATGAGAGTAAVVAGGRNAATLPSGTPVTVRLIKPATVTVEE